MSVPLIGRQDAQDAWGAGSVLGVLGSVLSVPAHRDADLMRPDAPQVSSLPDASSGRPAHQPQQGAQPVLSLVDSCPKWCREDHTVQAGADRECHLGESAGVRLTDGTLLMEVQLVHEAGERYPQLAVFGPGLDALKVDDVTLLGADEAAALEGELQRLLLRVQKSAAYLQGNRPKRPRKNKQPLPPSLQHAPRETRLYLAERDGRRCFYCRTPFDDMRTATADHYVPRSVWECNMPANLVLSCEPCNVAKADNLTWSMAAVLLAWAGREAPEAGEMPSVERTEAAC